MGRIRAAEGAEARGHEADGREGCARREEVARDSEGLEGFQLSAVAREEGFGEA